MILRLLAALFIFCGFVSASSAASFTYLSTIKLQDVLGTTVPFLGIPVSSPVSLLYRLDKAKLDPESGATAALPPASLSPIFSNFSVTLISNDGQYSHQVTAPTLADFIKFSNGLACPSHVCNYSYHANTISASYNNVARAYYQQAGGTPIYVTTSIKTTGNPFQLEIRYRLTPTGSTYTFYAEVGAYDCAPGYSFNSVSNLCDLIDTEVASQTRGDNICILTAGWLYNDVDCDTLKTAGILSSNAEAGGTVVYTARTSYTDTVSLQSTTGDGSVVSRVTKLDDYGGSYRDDTMVSAAGLLLSWSRTNYPGSPPPQYPGDPGGSQVPTGDGGLGTVTTVEQCGSPGLPACSFDVTELSSGIVQTNALLSTANSTLADLRSGRCGGPGQPACAIQGLSGVESGLSSVKSAIESLDMTVDMSPVTSGLSSLQSTTAGVRGSIDALKAGQCGGPAQPACEVSLGESDENLDEKTFEHEPSSLLGPVQTRLSSFFSFEAPAHTSSCPSLSFDVTAWGTRLVANNNFMCDFLEQYRTLLSTLAYLGFLFAAIRTILEA